MSDITPEVVTFNLFTVADPSAPLQITFDFELDASNVILLTQEPGDTAFTTRVIDVEWSLNEITSQATFIISTYSPPIGTVVRIERLTSAIRVLDYEPGSTITAKNLNDDNNQEFFLIQEMQNDLERALFKDLTGSFWEGEGLRSDNCGQATTDTGWVTLAQAQALISGGEIANIDEGVVLTFIGDGVTTEFELQSHLSTGTARWFISINGVLQHAGEPLTTFEEQVYAVASPGDSDYPDSAGFVFDVLLFNEPPASGDEIEARLIRGSVVVTFQDDSVSSNALPDGVLEFRHLDDLHQPVQSRILFNPDPAIPTFEDASSIALFEATLNAWLRTKRLSDLKNNNGDGFGNENLVMTVGGTPRRITELSPGVASTDAATVGQIGVPVRMEQKSLGTVQPAGPQIATFLFSPDIVLFHGRNSDSKFASAIGMFFLDTDFAAYTTGSNPDGGAGSGTGNAVVRFVRGGTGSKQVTVSINNEFDFDTFTNCTLVGIKL